LLHGLDYLITTLENRNMKAVIYLSNAWEWSGGYGSYLEWAGAGKAPIPSVDGWPAYMDFVKQFVTNDAAKQLYYNHVRNIVTRVNSITGIPYAASPAIMSWQIANEPRAFSEDSVTKRAFADWIHTTAKLIKELDPNHLVSTGSEGKHGCEQDLDLWEEIHSYPEIDYGIIHLWPYNWSWINAKTIESGVDSACVKADNYITMHSDIMHKVGKPLVLEEFGYPRDGLSFTPGSPTTGRDKFYEHVFQLVERGDLIDGCNFWGWGGLAHPTHVVWQSGDAYVCDPAQEEQGLNSVFVADSTTIAIIKASSRIINTTNEEDED
jgi:mannan endo-1,4-beta-mannosidase